MVHKRAIHRRYVPEVATTPGLIGLHIRNYAQHPERNWKHGKAVAVVNDLTAHGLEVICFGSKDGSTTVADRAEDARGVPLSEACAKLATCEMIVGPSSGTMHLANYCGTPAVWWSGNRKDVNRYGIRWNPFHLPNVRVAGSWDPSVQDVLRTINTMRAEQAMEAP